MFFNNPTANFSQASTGPLVESYNLGDLSDSSLGASSACFGITPIYGGVWSANAVVVLGQKLYYNSSLTLEVDPFTWYSDAGLGGSTYYYYGANSVEDIGSCSSPSLSVTWDFVKGAGTTGNFKMSKNGSYVVNITGTNNGILFVQPSDVIKSEISCSSADFSVSDLTITNAGAPVNWGSCASGYSSADHTDTFSYDGYVNAETINNPSSC